MSNATQSLPSPDPADARHWEEQERTFLRDQRTSQRARLLSRIGLNVAGVVGFLLIWELTPRLIPGINEVLFPRPSHIIDALITLTASGEIARNVAASLQRALFGFALASVLGIGLGLVTGRSRIAQHVSDPLLHGMRSIPSIALVPLSLLWFGIGEASKVALITWGAFFPIWLNTFTGVKDVHPVYTRSAACLGANRVQTMFLVVLPAAMPFILAGLRQGLGIALVVLVAAELAGASSGVGYMIATSHQIFRVDVMFVGMLILGILGFTLDQLFALAQAWFFPWYSDER